MMSIIRDMLAEQIANWECLGHPALLERFVLRNGKVFAPRKRIGRKRKAKECFSNATKVVMGGTGTYVEGFTIRTTFPFPLLHAWVTVDGSDAMDPTLNADEFEYFGVVFDRKILCREIMRSKMYGLLDTGLGNNTRLIFEIDPELEAICTAINRQRRSI
jgi:hypothetical protein